MRARERLAGALSLLAGIVHAGLGPAHFDEWWGYGLLFVAAASAQVVLGLALLLDALDSTRPGAARMKRMLFVGGLVGNALLVALYVVTRTVGVPTGPDAGRVEPVGLLDLATQAAQLGVIALLAWRLLSPGAASGSVPRRDARQHE